LGCQPQELCPDSWVCSKGRGFWSTRTVFKDLLRDLNTTTYPTTDSPADESRVTHTLGNITLRVIQTPSDDVGAQLGTTFLKGFFRPTYTYASKGAAFNIRQGAAHRLPDIRWVHATGGATAHYISHGFSGCAALRHGDALKNTICYPYFGKANASIQQVGGKLTRRRNILARAGLRRFDVLNTLPKPLPSTETVLGRTRYPGDLCSARSGCKPLTNPGHPRYAPGDKVCADATHTAGHIRGELGPRIVLKSLARSTEDIFGKASSAFTLASPKLGEPSRIHSCGFKTGTAKLDRIAGERKEPTDECARGRTNRFTYNLCLGDFNSRFGDGLKLTPKGQCFVTGSLRPLEQASGTIWRIRALVL
jgi:hypothetical protein